MTKVLLAQGIAHDVQSDRVDGTPEGVDVRIVRTHCGRYVRESVAVDTTFDGVPTCMACVTGRALWEKMVDVMVDAGGRPEDLEP